MRSLLIMRGCEEMDNKSFVVLFLLMTTSQDLNASRALVVANQHLPVSDLSSSSGEV